MPTREVSTSLSRVFLSCSTELCQLLIASQAVYMPECQITAGNEIVSADVISSAEVRLHQRHDNVCAKAVNSGVIFPRYGAMFRQYLD